MASSEDRHDRGRILPLTAEDIAQIQSSISITRLEDVVVGLLCNSFDAEATKINIEVNFSRGNCTVEDTGSGIPASEFEEDGGILKCYYTSKARSIGHYGRNGAFLASLSAMSLLHIVSKSDGSAGSNSITAHQSKVSSRCIPARDQQLEHVRTGTKVSVRNLFGNMPVRVQQRAMMEGGLDDVEWNSLVRTIVAYLLASKSATDIRLRNETTGKSLHLKPKLDRAESDDGQSHKTTTQRISLDTTLSLLIQASFIPANSWPSWVPISAKTSSVKIRGVISLDPCPTKHYQFMAIGIRPILNSDQTNELYAEVNRLISASCFGSIDDQPDEAELMRRDKDRRFKQDGATGKQLKGNTKGVDRWPMFVLHIEVNNLDVSPSIRRAEMQETKYLQSILKVLGAMTTQWLAVHGFAPRKRAKRSAQVAGIEHEVPPSQPSPVAVSASSKRITPDRSSSRALQSLSTNKPTTRGSAGSLSVKDSIQSQSQSGHGSTSLLQSWSRIKSGRAGTSFFPKDKKRATSSRGSVVDVQQQDSAALPHAEPSCPQQNSVEFSDAIQVQDQAQDTWITWQDPQSREIFDLNTRSGLLVPAKRPRSAPSNRVDSSSHDLTRPASGSALRLESRFKSISRNTQHAPWLKSLVDKWDNPVFKNTEQPLQSVSFDDLNTDQCTHRHDKDSALIVQENRLSAADLRKAKVISRLDNKFILIKMPAGTDSNTRQNDELLVIVDQHAADERCKVEDLLRQLCEPSTSSPSFRSNLGHQSPIQTARLTRPINFETSATEAELLVKHAAYLAKWGILYDVLPNLRNAGGAASGMKKVVIQTLPPVILERCTTSPRLIIDLLRSEVYSSHPKPLTTTQSHPQSPHQPSSTNISSQQTHPHLSSLTSLPRTLHDLINSRACRSAIMFNDVLSLQECEELVQRLAKCAFPFMCAHGRPSMVPVLGLGGGGEVEGDKRMGMEVLGDVEVGVFGCAREGEDGRGEGFVGAFQRWKGRNW